jgi:2-dehydro-3-deoxy-D-gluconate 5-dehydrogenase
MTSSTDISGRTAVITGASRGIGSAVVEEFLRAGANVLAVSRTSGNIAADAPPGGLANFSVDLSNRQQLQALPGQLEDRAREMGWQPVSILINNAGIIHRQDAISYSIEDWDRVLETNLTSPFLLTQALAQGMLERNFGSIVFVASLLSYQGGIRVPAYTASKSGIRGIVAALSNEWAALGVNVNGIAPGYITTDNTRALRQDPKRNAEILTRIPAGRWGEPQDVAGAIRFLCSPAARYIHGHVLAVDGGWLAR